MKQSFFTIAGLNLNYYGLLISLGLILTYLNILSINKKINILKEKILENLFFIVLPFVLIGARLYHVFDNYSYYIKSPIEIFFVQKGGLGIFGALVGFFIGTFFFCKNKKISFIYVLNLLAPSILIAQAIGRIGNYFNREAVGLETNFFLGITINSKKYHPVFLYESILCFAFFVIYLLLPNNIKKNYGLSFYLISYGIIRLITETFRNDTWHIGSIKVANIISLIFICVGVFLLRTKRAQCKK
jgi:prolipoprotein diacylglyceryl transferase